MVEKIPDQENFFKNELLKITKPARYIGEEWNILVKNPSQTTCSVVLGFPDIYEIGMSHLGLKILYQILNDLPGVRAERAFVPWPDLGKLMKEKSIPLFSLENKIPIRSFDILSLIHISEPTRLLSISYAVFCLKKTT